MTKETVKRLNEQQKQFGAEKDNWKISRKDIHNIFFPLVQSSRVKLYFKGFLLKNF